MVHHRQSVPKVQLGKMIMKSKVLSISWENNLVLNFFENVLESTQLEHRIWLFIGHTLNKRKQWNIIGFYIAYTLHKNYGKIMSKDDVYVEDSLVSVADIA